MSEDIAIFGIGLLAIVLVGWAALESFGGAW